MSLHYDEKGKFFTDYISKDSISASIHTSCYRIQGNIYVRVGERLTDELNGCEQFLPVTDASVFDLNGKELYRSDFIIVNRDQIVLLVPEERKNLPGTGGE